MTREEFVRGYANRSGLSDKWSKLGLVDAGGTSMIALPCGCGEERCDGWAMLSAESALHHLAFYAPEKLRDAYCAAVHERESEAMKPLPLTEGKNR